MKKIFLCSVFIPLFLTQASFWSFWDRGGTQKMNVSRNYHSVDEKYIDFTPAKFLKLRKGEANFALYFHANWCASCRVMNSQLNGDEAQLSSNVLKVNFDKAYTLRKKYGVVSPSTFIFFRDGRAVKRSVNPKLEAIVRQLR